MDRRRRIAAGLVALAVAAAAWLTSPAALLSRFAWVASDPARLALALVAFALVRPALAWPSTLITLASGYGYGLAGLPLALALLVLTSVPPYLLARRFVAGDRETPSESQAAGAAGPGDRETRSVSSSRDERPGDGEAQRASGGGVAAAGERLVDAAGDLRSVVASRLLPAPSDIVSVAAGVVGVPLRPYLLGTAVGETPWAVAGVLIGSSAGALTTDGLAAVADPRLLAAAALAAAALCVGPAYRRLGATARSRSNAAGSGSGSDIDTGGDRCEGAEGR